MFEFHVYIELITNGVSTIAHTEKPMMKARKR